MRFLSSTSSSDDAIDYTLEADRMTVEENRNRKSAPADDEKAEIKTINEIKSIDEKEEIKSIDEKQETKQVIEKEV